MEDIEKIVLSQELTDFIRGEKRFETIRPDVDYQRWLQISKYLDGHQNQEIHNKIVQTLLQMFDSSDWRDQYAVVGICQSIHSPEIDRHVEQNVLRPDFFTRPDSLLQMVSKFVMKKRLRAASKVIVEHAIKKNHIDWIVSSFYFTVSEQQDYWAYLDHIVVETFSASEEWPKLRDTIQFQKDETMKFIDDWNKMMSEGK